MPAYKPNGTQEQRILDLLRERGNAGVKSWEIPEKLGILQYNARIFGLRRKGYNIINTQPGHFVLKEFTPMTYETYHELSKPVEQAQQSLL